jgi:predicted RNA-binding protein with PUA-like domain
MNHYLIKSEPEVYSIDDLKRDKTTRWDCVRNYQARNFLREMKLKDLCLFYHSNASPSGIAGIAEVAKLAYPDPLQFDSKSEYYDPKASAESPRWFSPEVKFVRKFESLLSLEQIKKEKRLKGMVLLKSGRLSVQPVSKEEFKYILTLTS